jgi:spore maturation protein SpmB
MVLFLAINATSVALLPSGTIAVRAAAGSTQPAAIWLPTLIATSSSTLAAVAMHFLLRRRRRFRVETQPLAQPDHAGDVPAESLPEVPGPSEIPTPTPAARAVVIGFGLAFVAALFLHVRASLARGEPGFDVFLAVSSRWMLPALIAALVLVGLRAGVPVYESAVAGAREALEVGIRIVPFLVIILVAVGMFRASGALDYVVSALDPLTGRLGVPAEALPMALLRPFSGTGAFGVMSEILKAEGPDSYVGMLVSTYQGTTETTFYVLAVYLGAARVREARHALITCLTGDLAGFTAATAACHVFFR